MSDAALAPSPDEMILVEHLPFEVDGGIAERAAIGLVVLATDYTIEHEWRQIMTSVPGVAIYESRIPNQNEITPENLRAMEPHITASTDLILPGAKLDVVAYGCTSASMAIGEEGVFRCIRAARPDALCTTPITAAFAAFRAFDAKRIAVLTPYPEDVNRIVADYITARGYEVPIFGSFNKDLDPVVARISPPSIKAAARQLRDSADVDAVFCSCTSVRIAECCAEMEDELGLPVTSSNHAMAWHALRLAGIEDNLPEWGRLYTLPLSDQE